MKGGRWLGNVLFLAAAAVITAGAIFHFRQETGRNQKQALTGFQVFLPGEEISALYASGDGLWVGGRDGVKCLDFNTGEVIRYVAEDLKLIYAAEICPTPDGTVWIGHNEGITLLYPDGRRTDFGPPELAGGRVNTILYREETGDVWVGSMEGADRFARRDGHWQPAERLTRENGLLSDPVNVLAATEGRLWFGSYLDNRPGGVSVLSDKGWEYFTVEDGLAHPYVNAILPLSGFVLAGCGQLNSGGLSRLEPSGESYRITDCYTEADGIPGPKVRWLYADGAGHLWITTESDGLLLCGGVSGLGHPIQGLLLTEAQGLSDNEIKRIAESEEYYWLAGRYGLTRIEKSAVKKLLEE